MKVTEMKVIDLLNKIANGEEVPKMMCYQGKTYHYNRYNHSYIHYDMFDKEHYLTKDYSIEQILNNEIEIIEEDKKIEKLEYKYRNTYGNVSQHRKSEEPIINKINEIIDKLNKLEEGNNR